MPKKKTARKDVDFVEGPVTFGTFDQLSEQELADIKYLTSMKQFTALNKAFLMRIKDFYRDSIKLSREDAYTSCWNAKALEDFLIEITSIELTKAPPPQKEDHFEENPEEELFGELPLAPDEV